ncbi:hypothetical protein FGO68_gene9416 [Halteria grandinella]|uniref:Uncharacterized protein n=1 Tax=Halteria grandinella TaxID=5974 RepID=A0A8J8NXA9_HALGN|nr:hypothetical protein FGO68_gene9416 [Halteria grandinella]
MCQAALEKPSWCRYLYQANEVIFELRAFVLNKSAILQGLPKFQTTNMAEGQIRSITTPVSHQFKNFVAKRGR